MIIRIAQEADLEEVLFVEREAFGSDEESNLARDLLADESAKPALSILAYQNDQAVGHILFTKAWLEPQVNLSISLLAPLAVIPGAQNQGIGGQLIQQGLKILTDRGIDLVFVLGHPTYYPRFGFNPAGKLGFEATFPIPDKNADAWMVKALKPGLIDQYNGKVICADAMNRSEYWVE
jgi:putative acetyltransferase